MADQFTRQINQVVRNNSAVRYNYIPVLDGTGASGAAVTTGAGAWGAYVDLAAAGAIVTEFWVCGFACYTAAGAQVFQVQLYDATLTVTLANFLFDPTAVTVNVVPLLVPFPIYRAAGTQVQARAGGAAAKALNCHLVYAIGL